MNELAGKTALVTGGSRGIGRATVIALGKAGAHVVVHYGRAAKEAEAVVAEVRESGGRASAQSHRASSQRTCLSLRRLPRAAITRSASRR
jgi:NAD(P)-dependent dehydrogenase (short-subunit alcohol dehydrogenase family)